MLKRGIHILNSKAVKQGQEKNLLEHENKNLQHQLTICRERARSQETKYRESQRELT